MKFESKLWRLNNLYTIVDKEGHLGTLKLNHSQNKVLTKFLHNRKLILKSRQQGISTLYVAYLLDAVIFNPNYQAGIQSYGQAESKKLKAKAKLMWEHLDPDIKLLLSIRLSTRNKEEMEFSNGASLRIGNFRGDTLQALHVSELAKIAATRPDKAQELKTGAFEAVSTNSRITIESTAEGATGMFYDMWQEAELKVALIENAKKEILTAEEIEYITRIHQLVMSCSQLITRQLTEKQVEILDRTLTPLDFMPIFLSWMDDPDCTLQHRPVLLDHSTENLETYFIDLSNYFYIQPLPLPEIELPKQDTKLPQLELTKEQLYWLSTKLSALGNDFSREYPATPAMAFEQSVEGSYFQKQYQVMLDQNRIRDIEYQPAYPVHTAWDLGMNDEMVILFYQVYEGYIHLIDEYHGSGEGFSYYIDVLNIKGYKYASNIFPHDVTVKELGSKGKTRKEILQQSGMSNIVELERLPFQESINIAREFILNPRVIVSTRCRETIKGLQNYRKKKDLKLGVYLSTDVHDIHSNYMAAFRYGAQHLKHTVSTKLRPSSHGTAL